MNIIGSRPDPAARGGFVPIEWYTTTFRGPPFAPADPEAMYRGAVEPEGRVHVGHFQATNLVDRDKPVVLERFNEVETITTSHGSRTLRHNFTSMTLPAIQALMRNHDQ